MCRCDHTPGPGYVDLGQLITRVTMLEVQMATQAEQIAALTDEFREFVEDVTARVSALEAERGNFSAEGQAAFDALKGRVDAAVAAIGDADGDGTPAAPSEEPAPTEPGDTTTADTGV